MRHNVWTEITRPKYERAVQRYATDLTDAEWALLEPQLPTVKLLGRPRVTSLRAVLDGILYIARTGCRWRLLPKDFPPFTSTICPAKADRFSRSPQMTKVSPIRI
jgi:transposase